MSISHMNWQELRCLSSRFHNVLHCVEAHLSPSHHACIHIHPPPHPNHPTPTKKKKSAFKITCDYLFIIILLQEEFSGPVAAYVQFFTFLLCCLFNSIHACPLLMIERLDGHYMDDVTEISQMEKFSPVNNSRCGLHDPSVKTAWGLKNTPLPGPQIHGLSVTTIDICLLERPRVKIFPPWWALPWMDAWPYMSFVSHI